VIQDLTVVEYSYLVSIELIPKKEKEIFFLKNTRFCGIVHLHKLTLSFSLKNLNETQKSDKNSFLCFHIKFINESEFWVTSIQIYQVKSTLIGIKSGRIMSTQPHESGRNPVGFMRIFYVGIIV
jgi:hypothetical protein